MRPAATQPLELEVPVGGGAGGGGFLLWFLLSSDSGGTGCLE